MGPAGEMCWGGVFNPPSARPPCWVKSSAPVSLNPFSVWLAIYGLCGDTGLTAKRRVQPPGQPKFYFWEQRVVALLAESVLCTTGWIDACGCCRVLISRLGANAATGKWAL